VQSPKPKPKSKLLRLTLIAAAVLAALAAAGAGYYKAQGERFCIGCHEIQGAFDAWQESTHRKIPCADCHGDLFSLDIGLHLTNLRRVTAHARGQIADKIRIRDRDMDRLLERCRACHQEEATEWESGPHGAAYPEIFLNETHNASESLIDDCLRCHGMFFEGAIRLLVEPTGTKGPWRLLPALMEKRAVMPCFACHQVHTKGAPLGEVRSRGETRVEGPAQELYRPSLAFYDRRGSRHIPAAQLPMAPMHKDGRKVQMSADPRQALCSQCHAALAGFEVASGDDRTPTGVHEGLSCLACHERHRQGTRASCSGCHPRLSNCGLDVETMDTTFLSKLSHHDIHFVTCAECHPGGVPQKKKQ